MEQKAKLEKDECKLELEQTKEKLVSLTTKQKVCLCLLQFCCFQFFLPLGVGNLLTTHESLF